MNTREIGKKGEDIACLFLEARGFKVILRNYQKKWGEIDIIAQKDKITHFFEVKTVTGRFSQSAKSHRPEDNVHAFKLKHIGRMIETFMMETRQNMDTGFKFHVISVYMDASTRRAKVDFLEDIII